MTNMADIGRGATDRVVSVLIANTGLAQSVAAISREQHVAVAPIGEEQVIARNVAFDLAERVETVKYPAVYVYCQKISNQLKEKFRSFSGQAHMVIEIRISSDRLEGLEHELQLYAGAVTQVLDQHRGDWGKGMLYAGGYEAVFGSAKRGGKNWLQTAKVTFEVEVSIA